MDSDYENELMDHIDQFSEKTSRAGTKNEGAISIKKIEHKRTLTIDSSAKTASKKVLVTTLNPIEKSALKAHIKDFTDNLKR